MILTPIQSLLALIHYCYIIGREITNASIRIKFVVSGVIRRQIESIIIRTEEDDGRYTTDALVYKTCMLTQHFNICRSIYDLKVVAYFLFKPHLYAMVKLLTKVGDCKGIRTFSTDEPNRHHIRYSN